MIRKIISLLALCLFAVFNLSAGAQENAPEVPEGMHELNGHPPASSSTVIDTDQEHVAVKDTDVVLKSHIRGDVLVVEGNLTIERGARVDGHVVVIGGKVTNEVPSIQVTTLSRGVASALESRGSVDSNDIELVTDQGTDVKNKVWFGEQASLLLLALLIAGVFQLVAPRAAQQITQTLSLEVARSFVVGLIGVGVIGFGAVANAVAFHTPLRLVWAPFGFVLLSLVAVLWACSWVCGMKLAGDFVAHKLGRHDVGNLFGRMALGLGTFFVAFVLMHTMSPVLSGLVLLTQTLVAVAGLGAILLTGFGTDPDWLSRRLRGDVGWFRR